MITDRRAPPPPGSSPRNRKSATVALPHSVQHGFDPTKSLSHKIDERNSIVPVMEKALDDGAKFDLGSLGAVFDEGRPFIHYKKNETIFLQGDPADAVFYIQKGKAKITVISEQGKEAVVGVLGTGDFFGEGCVAGQKYRLSTLTSMTDSVIMRSEKEVFVRALREEPALADMFIRRILGRSIRVEADLVDQMFNSSEKRLARHLLILANFSEEAGSQSEIGKISQETLADMIGTTRSRVNSFMNKFRKLGLIDYSGQIIVHRSLLNYFLHD